MLNPREAEGKGEASVRELNVRSCALTSWGLRWRVDSRP